jgi:hypothetical protein
MKNHEWKAMDGSRKTAFFEEKKANCGTNWTMDHFDAAAHWIEGEFSSKFG